MNPIVKPVVAVVDDDPRIRESLESLIESAGFTAQVFALGEDFLQRENLTETKCLITDIRMPGMDGLALQRRVRLARTDLPVIFITAHHNDELERSALAGGAVCFIRKPFDAGDLLRATKVALGKAYNDNRETHNARR